MAKPGRNVTRGPQQAQETTREIRFQQQIIEGPIPSPDTLFQYDQLLPGTADRIVAMAEREQAHRMNQEDLRTRADIKHREDVLIAQKAQARGVFTSDLFGQSAGLLIGATCVVGAIYLALQPSVHPTIPIALVSLPIASIINAIRQKKAEKNPPGRRP